jgi:hypothetical protein
MTWSFAKVPQLITDPGLLSPQTPSFPNYPLPTPTPRGASRFPKSSTPSSHQSPLPSPVATPLQAPERLARVPSHYFASRSSFPTTSQVGRPQFKHRHSGSALISLRQNEIHSPDRFETNFKIVRALGSGEFSEVYEVEDRENAGLFYAVKRTKHPFGGHKDRFVLLMSSRAQMYWLTDVYTSPQAAQARRSRRSATSLACRQFFALHHLACRCLGAARPPFHPNRTVLVRESCRLFGGLRTRARIARRSSRLEDPGRIGPRPRAHPLAWCDPPRYQACQRVHHRKGQSQDWRFRSGDAVASRQRRLYPTRRGYREPWLGWGSDRGLDLGGWTRSTPGSMQEQRRGAVGHGTRRRQGVYRWRNSGWEIWARSRHLQVRLNVCGSGWILGD